MAKIDNFTEQELREIVENSFSMNEVIDKLGYATHSGGSHNTVKKRIELYNIDISHFGSIKGIKRTEENVFIENSTASQATLRRWYKKGEYTPYICSICGQEPIWQGKDLTLILDHINGSNHDDRLENLRWVCPNCNQQLDTTNGKNLRNLRNKNNNKNNNNNNYNYNKILNYCIDCGKEISRGAMRCISCEQARRHCEKPITREELKRLIRNTPFTRIGEQFGVSDNAIRKWCDSYNLPRKVSDIKKYTNEEWNKI